MLTDTIKSDMITHGIVRKKMYRRPSLSTKQTDERLPIEFTNASGIFRTKANVLGSLIDSIWIPVFCMIVGP